MYNWAAVEIFSHLAAAKLLKLSALLFLDAMLPSSKAHHAFRHPHAFIVSSARAFPSGVISFFTLRSTLKNLRCSKISIGRASAEEPRGVVEARGYHVPIRKGFGTQKQC
jgi:hypothetical protein